MSDARRHPRGSNQFRAQVRRNGVYLNKTFETIRAAQQWRRVTDGQVSGDLVVDTRTAKQTTLGQACDWMLEGSRAGTNANAKNVNAKLRYWKTTGFSPGRWPRSTTGT